MRRMPDWAAMESHRKKWVQCVNVVRQAKPCGRTDGEGAKLS